MHRTSTVITLLYAGCDATDARRGDPTAPPPLVETAAPGATSDTGASGSGTGASGTGTSDTPDTAPSVHTGDTSAVVGNIVAVDIDCTTPDHILVRAEAMATTGTALFNLWETGAPVGLGWNEEHDLVVTGAGVPELLERSLDDVTIAGWYARNSGSLFECTNQFAAFASSLTAAVRVEDPVTGAIDCLIWGHDPGMVLSGGFYPLYTPVTDPPSLAGCTVIP